MLLEPSRAVCAPQLASDPLCQRAKELHLGSHACSSVAGQALSVLSRCAFQCAPCVPTPPSSICPPTPCHAMRFASLPPPPRRLRLPLIQPHHIGISRCLFRSCLNSGLKLGAGRRAVVGSDVRLLLLASSSPPIEPIVVACRPNTFFIACCGGVCLRPDTLVCAARPHVTSMSQDSKMQQGLGPRFPHQQGLGSRWRACSARLLDNDLMIQLVLWAYGDVEQ